MSRHSKGGASPFRGKLHIILHSPLSITDLRLGQGLGVPDVNVSLPYTPFRVIDGFTQSEIEAFAM